jgi:hypothetical protein
MPVAPPAPLVLCAEGLYACPVTGKVFTEHTHIAAVKTTGNVYAYEAVGGGLMMLMMMMGGGSQGGGKGNQGRGRACLVPDGCF